MNDTKAIDALIVGAGFAGMYMLPRLWGLGVTAQAVERGTGVRGARGIGIVTLARVAMSRAWSIPMALTPNCNKTGNGLSGTRLSPKFCPMRTTSRTALTCAQASTSRLKWSLFTLTRRPTSGSSAPIGASSGLALSSWRRGAFHQPIRQCSQAATNSLDRPTIRDIGLMRGLICIEWCWDFL
ncbi:MAG: hypothetical protein ACI9W2_004297 [Gammaproteobacteria bacterium]|jgi:hypothetical protein